MLKSKFRKILICILTLVAMFSFATFAACDCGGEGGENPTPPPTPDTPQAGTTYEVIQFDQKEVSMIVGDETYILAKSTSYSELPITYTSSDPSIVKVDALGKVEALKKGSAKIIATSGNYKAECSVTVTHGNLTPELNVYGLIADSYTVPQGTTYALNYEVLFNKKKYENVTLSVSTNNSNITTDVQGNVINITGNLKGETELTVKASWDGISDIPAMTKTVTIKVIGHVSIVINNGLTAEVYIANDVLETLNGPTSKTAPFVVSVEGTSNNPSITIADESIATYADGVITGKGKLGVTEATISVTNDDDEVFSLKVPVTCEKAVGDYMNGNKSDYEVVDFNTLTGIIDLNTIFGADVTLVEAFHGYQELEVTNNKITAGIQGQAFGEPQPIVITVKTADRGYNVKVKPYVFKDVNPLSAEYQFSCYDGIFFDEDFKLVDVETLLGAGKTIKKAYLRTADGQIELPISNDRLSIQGLDLDGSKLEVFTLAVASDDGMISLDATGYSLIIDEMSDFGYFYVPDGTWTYDRSGRWNITSGMEWDGYYVLANDLYYDPDNPDAYKLQGYASPYPHMGWSAKLAMGTFGSVGAKQVEDNNLYKLKGKGLTGVFDGRGHIIDSFSNYTWTAKGSEFNKLVDKALAEEPTDANKTTANGWKNNGYSVTNGGLFQLVNGATVKNIGFTNARLAMSSGLLSYQTFNGAQLENIYVHVDPKYSYNTTGRYGAVLSGTIGLSVVHRNVIIVNETDIITERASGVFGQSGSAYSKDASNWSNVYVISGAPLYGSQTRDSVVVNPYAQYDAEYLDGNKQVEVDNKIENICAGVSRYSTMDKFVADAGNLSASIATFDSNYWTLLDGVPIFTNAIQAKSLEYYVGDHIVGDSNEIENDKTTRVTLNYLGLTYIDVASIVIDEGDTVVSVDNSVQGIAKLTALGLGEATITASHPMMENAQQITIKVVPVVDASIQSNGEALVDNTAKIMLGQSTEISILSGNTDVTDVYDDFALTSDSALININGKTITALNNAGVAQVTMTINGGAYTFNLEVVCPELYLNGVLDDDNKTAIELGATTTVVLKYEGEVLGGEFTLTSSNGNVTIDGTTFTGVTVGQSEITVQYGVTSFTFTVNVFEVPTNSVEFAISAYDGVYFSKDLSKVVTLAEILGLDSGEPQLLLVKDTDGNTYRVDEFGQIHGIETTNEKGSIQLLMYTDLGATKVTFDTYTLVIDEASDFRYFTLDETPEYSASAITYSGDDWNWDGYYVLAKDIDAKAEGYEHYSTTTAISTSLRGAKAELVAATEYGLSGTFDGRGHTVSNLYVASFGTADGFGLFGYVNGGTIKNVGFENIFSGKNGPDGWTTNNKPVQTLFVNALVNGGTIQDVYLGVHHIAASPRYVLVNVADATSTIERVVVKENYNNGNNTQTGQAGGHIISGSTEATLRDIYVIGQIPVRLSGRTNGVTKKNAEGETLDTFNIQKVAGDAYMLDGQPNSATVDFIFTAGDYGVKHQLTNADGYEYYNGATKYEAYGISLIQNVKRYTSIDAMKADASANASTFANWTSDVWNIVDGVPFTNVTFNAGAEIYVGNSKVIDGFTHELVEGDTINFSVFYNGQQTSLEPTITVDSGDTYIAVNNATAVVTASGANDGNPIQITVSFEGMTYTQKIEVYRPITPELASKEYYFSAGNGKFYAYDDDTDTYTLKTVDDIFGGEVDVVRAYDAQGVKLSVNENDEILGLDLGAQTTWTDTTVTLYTADAGKIVNVIAADLIIKQAEDLAYFTLDGDITYTSSGISYSGDDWVWDGYYILVEDIVASDYVHTTSNSVSGNLYEASAELIASTDFGLSGVFDGQGHTITALGIQGTGNTAPGFFTFINGGTVKNVAFVDMFSSKRTKPGLANNYVTTGVSSALFANAIVNGAKVEDVYMSSYRMDATRAWRFVITADNTASMTRVVYEDNHVSNGNYGGYIFSSDFEAQMNDVYLISKLAITTGTYLTIYDGATKYNGNKVTVDAYMVDGVEVGEEGATTATYSYMTQNGTNATTVFDMTKKDYYNKADGAGDKYTPYSIDKMFGVKRYSTIDKMKEDTNNDFSGWTNAWEIVDGIPQFLAMIVEENSEYTAYLNDVALPSEAKTIFIGDNLTATVKLDGKLVNVAPTVEIVDGEGNPTTSDAISVGGGATITASAVSNENVFVKISYRNKSWTVEFKVNNTLPDAPVHSGEFYFSASDGLLFDSSFNVVSFDTIFGGTDVAVVYAMDKDGNELSILTDQEGDKVLGYDLGPNTTWKEGAQIKLYTETLGATINLTGAADLIIDDATDFDYFSLDGTSSYDGSTITYSGDDWNWDGYYVVVKDIDASTTLHNVGLLENTATGYSKLYTATSAHIADTEYGLSGVFDGQGYTIKNLGINGGTGDGVGLFTFVNGGTIKNVAFEELHSAKSTTGLPANATSVSNSSSAPFINAIVNNGLVQDVYLSVNHISANRFWKFAITADSSSRVERVVIQDNYNRTSSNGGYIVDDTFSAEMKDVYVIAGFALGTGGRWNDVYKNVKDKSVTPEDTIAYGFKATIDAEYLNGVQNTAGTHTHTYLYGDAADTKVYDLSTGNYYTSDDVQLLSYDGVKTLAGVKRYTSIDKMKADVENNNFASWAGNTWEVVNGVPYFTSSIVTSESVYTAYLGENAVTTDAPMSMLVDGQLTANIKLDGQPVSIAPQVEIVSGADAGYVGLEGAKVIARAVNGENLVQIKITYKGISWTQEINVFDNSVTPENHATTYYFSAADGKFFSLTDYSPVTTEDIFGAGADVVRAEDAEGNALTVNADDDVLGLDLGAQTTWTDTTVTLYTSDAGLIIPIKAADLIIDDATDFNYFTLDGTVNYDGSTITYVGSNWIWDGYYVVVKDIDASNFNHKNGLLESGASRIYTAKSAHIAATEYGLSGVFDGQGHTIKKLGVSAGSGDGLGLFTFVNGGTIKNVAFEELHSAKSATGLPANATTVSNSSSAPFINAIVNNGLVQDVYLSVNHISANRFWKFAITADSSSRVERVVIQDNYNRTSSNGGYLVDKSFAASMIDVYVIANYALGTGGRWNDVYKNVTDKTTGTDVTIAYGLKATIDAEYLDNVQRTTGTHTQTFLYGETTSQKVYDLSTGYFYTSAGEQLLSYDGVKTLDGVKRYTSLAKMQECEASNAWTDWDTNIWNINSGAPKFITMG